MTVEEVLQYVIDVAIVDRPRCRECGCTDDNCENCIEKTGEPCCWVEADLCSACAPVAAPAKSTKKKRARAAR
jgi:hypothetical protein